MFEAKELQKALDHLSNDSKLKVIIEKHEPPHWEENPSPLFEGIVESIISQQISVKAADSIYARFLHLYSGTFPSAQEILATPDETIRTAGISRPKIKYIKGLAHMIKSNEIDLNSFQTLPNEKVIDELTKIKGIGQWTAEMLLIFELRRADVFSFGDLGLRNAVSKIYGIDRDNIAEMEKIVVKWSPYRTLASRYLWKSLDNTPK